MLQSFYKNVLTVCLVSFLTALVFSHNLIFFFISWTGINVSLYGVLLFSTNKSRIVTEAISKYFIIGVLITITFLFSTLLYLVAYGTYSTEFLSFIVYKGSVDTLSKHVLTPVELFFYISNISLFLFKLGSFPFHFYLPDIYAVLDKKNNMLIYTVIVKVAIFLSLLSFLSQFWFLSDLFSSVLLISSIGSLFVSSISSIVETNIRRFLSLSYLNSLGYVLLAVSSGLSFGFGSLTFYSAELYLASYIVAWLLVYIVMCNGSIIESSFDKFIFFSDLSRLSCSRKKNAVTSLTQGSFIAAVVSFLGLPPTIGFYSKTILYLSIIASDISTYSLLLVLFLAPIMSMSYIRLLATMLFPSPSRLNYIKTWSVLGVIDRDISVAISNPVSTGLVLFNVTVLLFVFILPIPFIYTLLV